MFLIIPLIYQVYLDKDSLNMWEYKSIMESEFDISVKSSSEIMGELLRKEKKKINHLAFKFRINIEWIYTLHLLIEKKPYKQKVISQTGENKYSKNKPNIRKPPKLKIERFFLDC